MAYVVV